MTAAVGILDPAEVDAPLSELAHGSARYAENVVAAIRMQKSESVRNFGAEVGQGLHLNSHGYKGSWWHSQWAQPAG